MSFYKYLNVCVNFMQIGQGRLKGSWYFQRKRKRYCQKSFQHFLLSKFQEPKKPLMAD